MPKCGTTALYEYLRDHPQIFLPSLKEPHFFSEELRAHRSVFSWKDYVKLFAGAGPAHRAVGEASPYYLPSRVALPRIRSQMKDARLIVMLRPPDAFLRSLHSDMCWICCDDQPDCEMAWRLQDQRQAGQSVPRLCPAPWMLHYRELASFGSHLRRCYELFRRDQVLVLLLEDLQKSPQAVYEKVLAFLGLETDCRSDFPRVNASKRNRSVLLARCYESIYQSLPRGAIRIGKQLGLGAVKRMLVRMNTQRSAPAEWRDGFRREVLRELDADIVELSRLLGRDLSHWRA
jgi:hypothetical protein